MIVSGCNGPQSAYDKLAEDFSLETYFVTKSHKKSKKSFNYRNFPPKSTIVRRFTKFRELGTVVDLCSKATGITYPGRKKSARTEEKIAAVSDSVGRSPSKSLRRHNEMTKTFLRTYGSQMKPIFLVSLKTMPTRKIP